MRAITDFINQNLNLASSVSQSTGVPVQDILGQWGLETGWGSSFAGQNNFGNVSPGGIVANYSSAQAGANAYANVLMQDNVNSSSPSAFAQSVASAGYATDPNYASKLLASINTVSSNMNTSSPYSGFDSYMNLLGLVTSPITQAIPQAAQAASSSPSNSGNTSTVSWLSSHLGNYGLVFFGAVLIVGALLISQKETIMEIAK